MRRRRGQGGRVSLAGVAVALAGFALLVALHFLAVLASVDGLGPSAASAPGGAFLVLGAAQYDGQPSTIFESRLLAAAHAYGRLRPDVIVVSGGRLPGDRFSEGDAGRRFLLRAGLPAGKVVAETRARNTVANLRNSEPLTSGLPVTLVTDAVHATRALALAQSLGLNARVLPAGYPGSRWNLVRYAARESLATAVYALTGPVAGPTPL